MKNISFFIFFFISVTAIAQGEADNWYFGNQAGMKFQPDGTVTPLVNGLLSTTEGCSTISDADGNLLFYTDGRTVWDRNHVIMPNGNYFNGNGLLGDPSSTQSGIIVPKKGDPDIYYIFTVDEPHHQNAAAYPNQFQGVYDDGNGGVVPNDDDGFNNGFNYSVVDLSVTGANGSIGDVVTQNQHLVTYDPDNTEAIKYKCSEKITAVKNSNNSGYWVITHFIDRFYAFEVTAGGVNETPVITTITPLIPTSGYRRNSIGYIKASPNGEKIAVAHMQSATITGSIEASGMVYLYDFNDATGVISNPVLISQNSLPYGIEFSPSGEKLYVSYDNGGQQGGLRQYNLLSPNIASSNTLISNTLQSGALQLGPNGKIYRARGGVGFLDVINSPEEDGALCNFQPDSQSLGSRFSSLGLPPFITSVFSADIIIENTCLGDTTQFSLNSQGSFDAVSWDFGDGSPASSDIEPEHTYASIGDYNVTATITRGDETTQVNTEVTINEVPVANQPPDITECNPNNTDTAVFNLTVNNSEILDGQDSNEFEISYFISQTDADSNTQALQATAYTNTSNPQTIYARIQNQSNNDCYDTVSFEINVATAPTVLENVIEVCDDDIDGNGANGRAEFNLGDAAENLLQNSVDYSIAYFTSEAQAEIGNTPLGDTFYNTVPNQQTIYARIENIDFPDCFAIEPIQLIVNPLPPVINDAVLVQCDTGNNAEGITLFNLTEADSQFTGGNTNLEVSYYPSLPEAENDDNSITTGYTNTANPEVIAVKVTNTDTGCFRLLSLTLAVNVNLVDGVTLQKCDDDSTEDGLYNFDLTEAGIDTEDDLVYYANLTDALMEQNAIGTSYTNVIPNQQSVYARIENNNECVSIQEIELNVLALPRIDSEGEAIVCQNTNSYIILSPEVSGSTAGLSYNWSTGAQTSTLLVNEPGVYTVTVTNSNNCEKVKAITVSPSDVAVISNIRVNDLRDNNTVTVFAEPASNVNTKYLYSLDKPDGPWQESNIFENVEPGIHTVYVYDNNGCGVTAQDIAVLEIPKFFTPNGDGVNETWRITGINSEFYENSNIYVMDRFGKLLATVDPKGIGWDGIFNGYKLPATDYWYVIELQDGRVVKGHFSMIR